jgi:uncharacterized HhH-GPD family protein
VTASLTIPERLFFSGDAECDHLLATEPMALLIGFVLDQQVPLEWAFSSPHELRVRIGTLDAKAIAAMDPDALDGVFRRKPTLHRFPSNMARRTHDLATFVAERYGGKADRVWTEATDGKDLERRLLELPGIGPMKAQTLIAILVKRYAIDLPGLDAVTPKHPTLGDVDSDEARKQYQAMKREYKAKARAEGKRV